ncbi:DUF1642 domain-containing protein [Enterococcus faecium]|uniref:DUF1642 domain-containing protein n=1 Tax=Enterococcus TaxID=1350 RepID=UPI000AAC0FF8|nr:MULTISPECIES: DUF1642 domain-containing protein [Enterococcus]EGP5149235.1 DUF1642 domain-containing protein [Enterococcus faecium]EGP5331885.1 DUF1642 domain-containing protein [Enterococcus faecium]EGP5460666.1 DUF1642 domain-containing protein [Enterococcus faecium]MCL4608807.1 DUF1642 domain-containing protein [Enterococcus faecium]MCL4614055.1 DUF1642 domain-containing protein [Enterococcus faecium]
MNKQKLIDKWESSETGAPTFETRGATERVPNDDMYTFGYGVARKEILEDLKQLDEQQKLILPKCAEQWIEGHCAPSDVVNLFIEVTCATDSDGFIDSKWRWSTDFYEWLANDADTLYILCDALRYGYEVEKEPLYSVIIAGEYLVKEISCSNEVKLVSTAYLPQYLAHHYQLTEKQIKEIDERFWPFAVPVEEVVER